MLIYFLVYVDLIITGSDPSLVDTIIRQLDSKFSIKDLGVLFFFYGVKVLTTPTGLLLSQQKYVIDLLSKHNMLGSKPVSTPLVVSTSLTAKDGVVSVNATMYRQVVGGLQYLQMTRSDISFVVNKLSQFMHASSEYHWGAIKHLFRHFNGTRSLGIQLLADTPLTLHGFSNAHWASNPNDHTSTRAFLIFLGTNLISWNSTKLRTVARSFTEAEYRAIAVTVAEQQRVKSPLSDLLALVRLPPTLFSDNLGTGYLSVNPIFHYHMKHFVIDYHFVHDMVQSSDLYIVHVSASDQLVDALTKYLSRSRLFYLCNKVDVIPNTRS